jgi:hypothetical protein
MPASRRSPFANVCYVDPVFGTTVRRVTTDHAIDDLQSRNRVMPRKRGR